MLLVFNLIFQLKSRNDLIMEPSILYLKVLLLIVCESHHSVVRASTLTQTSVKGNDTVQYYQKGNEMIHATLPFLLRSAGFIECQGANSKTAGNFFGHILGDDINYNRSDYLCGPTCQGSCIPRPPDVGIPNDNLPYGCLCSPHGCDLNGPVVAPMAKEYYKMVCKPDSRCTCFGMGPGQFNGYSCYWSNTISGLPITFTEKSVMLPGTPGRPPVLLPARGTPRYLPIKWCSCCPRLPVGKNPN